MSKRRTYAHRELRKRLRLFVKDNRWPLFGLVGLYLLSISVGFLLGGRGYWQGFSHGSLLVLMLAGTGVLFLLHTGGLDQIAGIYGEKRTQEEVERALRQGSVWGAVHNIEFQDGDLDTVVFAPGGVLAIETKWKTRGLDRRWLGRDLAQAQWAARKARLLLGSKDTVQEGHEVVPVLVIWGRGGLEVPAGGEVVDDVHVVDGNELCQWLRRMSTGRLAEDHAVRMRIALETFKQSRSPASGRARAARS